MREIIQLLQCYCLTYNERHDYYLPVGQLYARALTVNDALQAQYGLIVQGRIPLEGTILQSPCSDREGMTSKRHISHPIWQRLDMAPHLLRVQTQVEE